MGRLLGPSQAGQRTRLPGPGRDCPWEAPRRGELRWLRVNGTELDSWGPGKSQPSGRRSKGLEFKCRETGAGSCRQGGQWAGGIVESSCLERGRWIGAEQTGLAVREALLLPAWPSDLGQATAAGAWSWESVSPAARCPEGNYLPLGTNLILLSLTAYAWPSARSGFQVPPSSPDAWGACSQGGESSPFPLGAAAAHHRAADMGPGASWAPLLLVF